MFTGFGRVCFLALFKQGHQKQGTCGAKLTVARLLRGGGFARYAAPQQPNSRLPGRIEEASRALAPAKGVPGCFWAV